MYLQLAEIPLPTAAQFLTSHDTSDGTTVVEVTYSVRDHVRNVKRTMSRTIVVPSTLDATTTVLQDVDIIGQAVSPSGKKTALLRSINGTSRIVEIWSQGLLEASLDATDYHGDFYSDEYLSSLSFSSTETSIIYVAEGKALDTQDPFQKFRFNPDFGEGLVGKRRPTVFVFRWKPLSATKATTDGSLFRLKTIDGVRFGQAIFSQNSDKTIYVTGYEFTQDGRLLGIKGCFNRPTGIWQLQLETESQTTTESAKEPTEINTQALKLSPAHLSCRSPRIISHEGRTILIWLASQSGGAHLASSTVYSLDITSDSLQIPSPHEPLVGIVDVPDASGFPGVFPAYNFPKDLLVASGHSASVLLQSQWGSRNTVLEISLIDGKVKNHTPKSEHDLYSWIVLATDSKSRILCSRSSPSVPYEILLGQLDASGAISWRLIEKPILPESVSSALATIRTSILPVPGRPLVETLVLEPKANDTIPPCITSPHGGPHGTTSTSFSATTSALVLEGYTLAFPNYTGSPGYGEKFLQDLVGKCGELDVQDCIASARHLINIGISKEGPGMQLITGGSHGGFLTAHLIGQFPTFFSAAILRNPVISCGDVPGTDIPDWYFSEFGHVYPIKSSRLSSTQSNQPPLLTFPPLVTVEKFESLQLASPISYVDSISIPVLLLIGAADRRVSPTQGIEFYHALKARYSRDGDKKVEMLIFEGESHPLDGIEAAKAGFEATKIWFADARKL